MSDLVEMVLKGDFGPDFVQKNMDYIMQHAVTSDQLADGTPAEMLQQIQERESLRAEMTKAYGYDPLNPPEEKPIDIMAETRRMLG